MLIGLLNIGKGQKGLLLLEALIAVSLLAFVMLVVTNSLMFGALIYDRLDAQENHYLTPRQLDSLLVRLIESATPYKVVDGETKEAQFVFYGTDEGVVFVGSPPASSAINVPHIIVLCKHLVNDKQALILLTKPLLSFYDGSSKIGGRLIVSDMEHISFRYFDHMKLSGGKASWKKQWDGKSYLPALVSVSFYPDKRYVGDDHLRWAQTFHINMVGEKTINKNLLSSFFTHTGNWGESMFQKARLLNLDDFGDLIDG